MPRPVLLALCLLFPLCRVAIAQSALIEPGALADRLANNPAPLVLLVAWQLAPDEREGCIPGAQLTRYPEDGWEVTQGEVPGMLPEQPELVRLIGRLGLAPERPVVIAATGPTLAHQAAAARVLWALRLAGFTRLSLLDGGLPAWEHAALPLAEHCRAAQPTTPSAHWRPHLLAGYDDVYLGEDYDVPPIDLRDAEHFFGNNKHPQVSLEGTIKGAVNVPAAALMIRDGRYRDRASMQQLFSDIVTNPSAPLIVFSDTGFLAAVGWFALHEILGHRDVRLYDGSFVEWEGFGDEAIDDYSDDMGGSWGG